MGAITTPPGCVPTLPPESVPGRSTQSSRGPHGGSSPVHLWPWTSLTHTGRTTEPSRAHGSALRATRQMTLANHLTSTSSVSPSVPHLLNRSAHWIRGSRTLVSRPGPGLPQQAKANLLCLKTLGCSHVSGVKRPFFLGKKGMQRIAIVFQGVI